MESDCARIEPLFLQQVVVVGATVKYPGSDYSPIRVMFRDGIQILVERRF